MPLVHFITHPEVTIDPAIPVPDWSLSPGGIARMRAALTEPGVPTIGAVFCSHERKAWEGAAILATHLGLAVQEEAGLGENDRSATGYLEKAAFEQMADAFFAHPTQSVRGWERAIDAQARIVAAVDAVLRRAPPGQDVAIVAHGGVGALLRCDLLGTPISRAADQPGNGGGNRFAFDVTTRRVAQDWRAIGLA